LNVLYHLAHYI